MESRPAGIAVLGIISFLGGVVLAFVGIVLMGVMAFGPAVTGSGAFLAGAATFALGIAFVGLAAAFWLGFPWALKAGLVVAVAGLVIAVANLILAGRIEHAVATVVFPVFLLWYLNRPSVKAAFEDRG